MKDFSSYQRKQTNDPMDALKNLADKYEGASENDLMKAILSEADKRKKAGTLTDSDIDAFASAVAPMLNSTQKAKLNAVIKTLKKS